MPPVTPSNHDTTRNVVNELFAEHGNIVPLEDFVHTALHAPNVGYYASSIATVGRSGDFSTFATANNDLARGIAAAIRDSGIRDILEVGAGNGLLAKQIITALGLGKRIGSGIRYHIVDTSAPLVAQQKKTLRGSFPTPVKWHDSVGGALRKIDQPAFIFGNELIDAFAPVVLMWRQSQQCWAEVCLQRNPSNGGIAEVAHNITDPDDLFDAPAAQFSALDPDAWPDGAPPFRQRIEIHATFRDWWQEWTPELAVGSRVCWIDYGDTFPRLYHREPAGTLRAYFRHERLTGSAVFTRLGKQDITSDVNFTDIRTWGESFGLNVLHDTRQSDWLEEKGVKLSDEPDAPLRDAHHAFRVISFEK